ncbi:5-hydroxytryptamine receptor 1B isoform 2-T2 [Menidia menidia]
MIEPCTPTMLDRTEPLHCTVCCCTLVNKILMVLFMVLLIFAILFGNLVTLAVVLGTKHFHTPQGYLKASLAVADLAVGIFVVPLSVYAEVYLMVAESAPEWTSYNSQSVGFHPCNIIGPIFAGCTFVSITTIFLLTVERSIAVLRPLHKDSVITRKRTTILIVLSWVGSFSLAVSPMIFSSEIALEYNSCSRMCNYALGSIASASIQSAEKLWQRLTTTAPASPRSRTLKRPRPSERSRWPSPPRSRPSPSSWSGTFWEMSGATFPSLLSGFWPPPVAGMLLFTV